ncbi:ABC transporter substrate-binding protein [Demequina aestuarii]|uniref:ABC transporter substrate-binding protein n=1 Tax=Demequina aestuarii TaxID=327095 RepID=UPI00078383A8|nr:sugar ABC transporter substrate-binding protein [Demequina aestuarii]
MRKTVTAGAGIVAGLLAMTACSSTPEGETTDGPTTASDEPVTITYSNFVSNGGNEENLAAIIDAFEAENPNITVDVTTFPYEDYGTALQTDLAGGTAADVFDIEYSSYAGFQANGVLAPLEGVDLSVYRGDVADAYTTDGTAYALPSSFSTVVLYFNKDLFDTAGLDYPTAEWTWEDEQAAAEALTDIDAGVWGDYQPISYYEFYKALVQAGGQFLDDDGASVAFNSPEGIAAAQWLVDKSGTVMPSPEQGAGTPDFDTGLWADGKLAMWHSGIWMFGAAADSDFAWDIAVEPGQAQNASAVFSNALGVSATSENQAAAQAFAAYLSSSPTMVDVRLDAGWELPPISDESQLAAYLDQPEPANRQAVFDSLDAIALPPVIGEEQARMEEVMGEQLTEAAAGRITVEEALDAAAEAVNGLIG